MVGLTSMAQYHSTVSSEYQWKGTLYGLFTQDITYYLQGDSVIDNVSYKKLFVQYEYQNTAVFQWLIREDVTTGQVFRHGIEGDMLVMDYSLQAGESTHVYGLGYELEITIDSVEMITVNNTPRRKLYFTDAGNTAFWIEGVGSSYGIGDAVLGSSADYNPVLTCFYVNQQLEWSSDQEGISCSAVLSVPSENAVSPELVIQPNPSTEWVNVRCSNLPQGCYIEVTSATGSLMSRSIALFDNTYRMDVATWPAGLYLVSVINERGQRITQRLIKQ